MTESELADLAERCARDVVSIHKAGDPYIENPVLFAFRHLLFTERKRAAAFACRGCAQGWPVEIVSGDIRMHKVPSGSYILCDAAKILTMEEPPA